MNDSVVIAIRVVAISLDVCRWRRVISVAVVVSACGTSVNSRRHFVEDVGVCDVGMKVDVLNVDVRGRLCLHEMFGFAAICVRSLFTN